MTDTQTEAADPAAARGARSARSTSVATWGLVLAVAAVLLCMRIPMFVAVAEGALAGEAAALGDPGLAETAVTIGAVSAVVMHVLLLALVAVLATLLERFLGPRALGGRLRIGVAGATFAVVVLGQQLAASVLGVASLERSWPVWVAAAAVALLAPAAFPESRASLRSYGTALVATCGVGVLLCVG